MRPIDADKLIRQLCLVSPDCDEFGRGVATGISTAIQKTADTPTLTLDDLRPKGRWEPVDARYSRCTNCKKERNVRTQIAWTFCPSCGADMRGYMSDGQRNQEG